MRTTILFVGSILLSQVAFGWGATGHRVTGKIAEVYLNKKARRAVEKILNHQSLAMASTWMDEVRSDSSYDYAQDWHWVTIPDGMSYHQTTKNPNGDLLEALERIVKALKSKQLSPHQETEYVKMLVHLVGDLHQPLHVGKEGDQGGNTIKLTWFRQESNLHRVWDSDMIDDSKLSYTELAESLGQPSPDQIKMWQSSSLYDWADESVQYRQQVYAIGNGKLSYSYPYKNFSIVRKRLLQAGVRIAGLLNEIYG